MISELEVAVNRVQQLI